MYFLMHDEIPAAPTNHGGVEVTREPTGSGLGLRAPLGPEMQVQVLSLLTRDSSVVAIILDCLSRDPSSILGYPAKIWVRNLVW